MQHFSRPQLMLSNELPFMHAIEVDVRELVYLQLELTMLSRNLVRRGRGHGKMSDPDFLI